MKNEIDTGGILMVVGIASSAFGAYLAWNGQIANAIIWIGFGAVVHFAGGAIVSAHRKASREIRAMEKKIERQNSHHEIADVYEYINKKVRVKNKKSEETFRSVWDAIGDLEKRLNDKDAKEDLEIPERSQTETVPYRPY